MAAGKLRWIFERARIKKLNSYIFQNLGILK